MFINMLKIIICFDSTFFIYESGKKERREEGVGRNHRGELGFTVLSGVNP